MDTTNLKRRHQTWFARVSVPRSLRATLGKSEVLRSLKTADVHEANRRKHAVIATINTELSHLAVTASLPRESAEFVKEVARAEREAILAGRKTEDEAERALDVAVEDFFEKRRRQQPAKVDPETGYGPITDDESRALQLAHRMLSGDEIALVSESVKKYLKEAAPRITKSGYAQKEKHLNAFANWLGKDAEVQTITRKVTGRYVSDVIQLAELAPKTKKDWIANLTAYGSWLEQYGVLEANPWRNLTRAIKESTRGGGKKKRPYTPDELSTLVKKLSPGDPLLPMACIAPYSGLRIEEIAAMKKEHIKDDAFRVMEAKNENSVRYVAIHPAIKPMVAHLLATSSDDYLISGLLPGGKDGKRSHYASKKFGTFLRSNGFEDRTLDFHSFRRSFTQRCENAGVPESTTQLLTGHARQSLTYGLYSPGPEFPALKKAVLQVSYGDAVDSLVKSLAKSSEITVKSRRRPRAVFARKQRKAA
jgi:integrase